MQISPWDHQTLNSFSSEEHEYGQQFKVFVNWWFYHGNSFWMLKLECIAGVWSPNSVGSILRGPWRTMINENPAIRYIIQCEKKMEDDCAQPGWKWLINRPKCVQSSAQGENWGLNLTLTCYCGTRCDHIPLVLPNLTCQCFRIFHCPIS